MKIATYNLRCVWDGGDGVNSFIHRAWMVYEKIKTETPDVIAFQEVCAEHAAFLEKMLSPEYLLLGHGRLKDYSGEGVYTAIKRDSMILSSMDIFWLSPTVYEPGSRFEEQSTCPRTCLMTLLREKATGTMLRVYNLHLDHSSESARRLGMECTLCRVREDAAKADAEIVILGDFNAYPDSVAISLCKAYPLVDVTSEIPASFHAYGKRNPTVKIDYIFLSDGLANRVLEASAWTDERNGIYLSDHYPISVVLK